MNTVGRRDLAAYFAGSALLAASCSRSPQREIVAFGRQPEETPGVPKFYATTMLLGGYATGLLVESHEGRPTKIEGNPEHPASLGASGALEQAQTLALYDPDRLRGARRREMPVGFGEMTTALGRQGSLDRVAILSEPTSSPTLAALWSGLERRGAKVFVHDPLPRTNVWAGHASLFGRPLDPVYDLSRARVTVLLDGDLFGEGPFRLRHARDRTHHRRANPDDPGRLYVVEPAWTLAGSVADHRLVTRRSGVPEVAVALLEEVARSLPNRPDWVGEIPTSPVSEPVRAWVSAVARDLIRARGDVVIAAGPAQPSSTHAIAAALMSLLASTSVAYVEPVVLGGGAERSLGGLLSHVDEGRFDLLVLLGGNPVYSAPADLGFAERIQRVPERVYLAPYDDETAKAATWVVPRAHFLESWGDGRALDGTLSYQQPLIAPLHGGKTEVELVAGMFGEGASRDGRELIRQTGRTLHSDFDRDWTAFLQHGVVPGSRSPSVAVTPRRPASGWRVEGPAQGVELVFREDPAVRDGAFTNNAWLLELPDPFAQTTWGNAAVIGEATAERMQVADGDVIALSVGGASIEAPVAILAGTAEDSIVVPLGWGRHMPGTLAHDVGFDAGRLRTASHLWCAHPLETHETGRHEPLILAQTSGSMNGRDFAKEIESPPSDQELAALHRAREPLPTLYELRPKGTGQQWAMTIDLDACTGCQACVIACQAENNVPTVGPDGVGKGRIMHWLRVDRYFEGDSVRHQPVACVQCEKAPCEYVCPVGATVHSDDGLNDMVYNRCVGTRFCSNNCPYKVRRFNWFDYNRDKPDTLRMLMNPDVTVRARGVMEKCTYCVQRIREAEIRSRATGAPMQDGDVVPACGQACPADAITFGSISDPSSRVSRLREDPRAYELLHELGTLPRTRHLARARRLNEEIPR